MDPILVWSVFAIAIVQVLSFIMRITGWGYGGGYAGPVRAPGGSVARP